MHKFRAGRLGTADYKQAVSALKSGGAAYNSWHDKHIIRQDPCYNPCEHARIEECTKSAVQASRALLVYSALAEGWMCADGPARVLVRAPPQTRASTRRRPRPTSRLGATRRAACRLSSPSRPKREARPSGGWRPPPTCHGSCSTRKTRRWVQTTTASQTTRSRCGAMAWAWALGRGLVGAPTRSHRPNHLLSLSPLTLTPHSHPSLSPLTLTPHPHPSGYSKGYVFDGEVANSGAGDTAPITEFELESAHDTIRLKLQASAQIRSELSR